jgi:nucleoside-diphosphate-sugar epimerase
VLFHCAGEIRDSATIASTNHFGTERLAGLAAGRVGRWVQLSTIGVYGNPRSGTIVENTRPAPCNAYELSKLRGDLALESVARRSSMPWSMLRPSIVFGLDMPNSSIRSLVEAVRRGRFFYIGNSEAVLPYVHVDDVVAALMLLGSHEQATGQIFNLSDDVALERFVEVVCEVSGCRRPRLRLPEAPVRMVTAILQRMPGFPLTLSRIDALTRSARYPADKIRRVLGYTEGTGWQAGLREMLAADRAGS